MKLELKLPKWANWVAKDERLEWALFENKPTLDYYDGYNWANDRESKFLYSNALEDAIPLLKNIICCDDAGNNRWKIESDGTLKHMPWVEKENS